MKRIFVATRKEGLSLLGKNRYFVVDCAAKKGPYRFLNPFHTSKQYKIPVPGQKSLYSNSVEAIWQGLKIVKGRTCFSMFRKRAYKRPPMQQRQKKDYRYEESRFLFGKKAIGLIKARHLIYKPAYAYLFQNYVPKYFKKLVAKEWQQGKSICFFDWDSNFDIHDPITSFSHSALLLEYFSHLLKPLSFKKTL